MHGEDWTLRVRVEQVRKGDGVYFVEDGIACALMLVEHGRTGAGREGVKAGDAVGVREPSWKVWSAGREWAVGVDWKVIELGGP